MAAMCDAALSSLQAKLLDPRNVHNEPLLRLAQSRLAEKRTVLQPTYARRLKLASGLIAEGRRESYHSLLGLETLGGVDALESEVLRTQIEWGRVQISLLQRTEQSLMALERVYRPLRKITLHWRNGNPLHHTVYLDSLQATLHDEGISTDITSLFLADMVAVLGEHLQTDYTRITALAKKSYADLLAKAEVKRLAAKDGTQTFARKAKKLFTVPAHCPIGAVKAYKLLMPALERMAARDATFWDDVNHPGRVLLQTIIDKATALKESGDVNGYPQFPGLVTETVERLSALRSPSAYDFSQALARFGVDIAPAVPSSGQYANSGEPSVLSDSQWSASSLMSISPGDLGERSVLPAYDQPSYSDLERMEQDVMTMVASNPHCIDADPAVLGLVTGAWPKVLAQVAETSGIDSVNFRAYRQVVPDVLALAGASAGAGIYSDADALIPSLLTRIKTGLTSIGWMPERIAPVLTAVAHFAPAAIMELEVLEDEAQVHAAPVIAPLAFDASIATKSPSESSAIAVFRICNQAMESGVWLEFLSRGEWTARQLSWMNPQSTMFLFTAADGATQSVTRRMLEKWEQDKIVRPR